MLSSNPWLFLSLEIELQTSLLMTSLRIDQSSEMELKKKCRNLLVDGVFGLRLARFKMLRFPQEVCSLIYKQNSERRAEWMQRKLLLILKILSLKRNLLEILNTTEEESKLRLNKKSSLLNKLLKSKLKKENSTPENSQLKPKRRKPKTKRESEKKKCNLSSRKREWNSKAKTKSTKLNFKSTSKKRPTS
jgi:hypothetical protein